MMLNWKAVILGAIVDFVGSYFGSFILALLWVAALRISGMPGDQTSELTSNHPLFLAISVTIGWFFDYLAGKVAASFSNANGPFNGVAAVVPGVLLELVATFGSASFPVPAWIILILCAVSIACGYYGGGKAKKVGKS